MSLRQATAEKRNYQCLSYFGTFLGDLGKEPVYRVEFLESKQR